MNKILTEIKKIAQENIKKYLPKVSNKDLEENGKIYYMNDKNGSTFDYYVNYHSFPFYPLSLLIQVFQYYQPQ